MFHHILIGYDGSANGKKALEYGIDFAMHAEAAVTIVTVFPRLPDYLGSPQYDQIVARLTTEANQIAEMAAEQARACGIEQVRVEVLEGSPAECILTVADTRKCDCIVVGSRGRGEMAGLLLGSASDRLAHHAKVPVLIVK
ncbi:MAG: universal stress protein [Chloroflexi bacterium]|nr:universal stress protein [Chloroflexota bacterium]